MAAPWPSEAAAIGSKVETATGFRRDASPAGVPSGVVTAAFRTPRMASARRRAPAAANGSCSASPMSACRQVDAASDEVKKLKETLQRGLTDEQVAQYVTKIESEIGTTINQAAFAQVTGANN